MRVAPAIQLDDEERRTLESWSDQFDRSRRRALRARIVLLAAEGETNLGIADRLGIDRRVAGRWRRRFVTGRLAGIEREAPRRGTTPAQDRLTRRILETTLTVPPPSGRYWTTRTLAAALGVSRSRVHRVWSQRGIVRGEAKDQVDRSVC